MADIQKALAVFIDHVNLHNILGEPQDRLKFLDARLVCRSWRNLDVFSRNITSVTLLRLADLQLAARFFPHATSPKLSRPPWRRLEDVSIFPNLRTLKISNHLSHDLLGSAEAELLCQECKDFDIEVLNLQPHLFENLAELFKRMRYVVSLEINFGRRDFVYGRQPGLLDNNQPGLYDSGRLSFMKEVVALPGLRRLVLIMPFSRVKLNLPSLGALSQIRSLRHLEIRELICSQEQLAQCLSLGSSLSHLTRLDLVLKAAGDATLSTFREDFERIAPRVLHTSRFTFVPKYSEIGTSYKVIMEGSGPNGLQAVDSSLYLTTGFSEEEAVSAQLYRTFKNKRDWPTCRFFLSLKVDMAAPDERFIINLSRITAVETIEVVLSYHSLQPDVPPVVRQGSLPVFEALPDVQMATKELRISINNNLTLTAKPILQSGVLKELPALFLNLQSLHVCSADDCRFDSLSSLRELTRLTQLGLSGIYSSDDADWDLHFSSFLPTSLKTLDLSKCQNSSVPSLDHCTALTNLRIQIKGPYNLESLFSCHAPLKSLSFSCLWYDLSNFHILAAALPLLEKLHLRIISGDVSPLSSLQYLRQLEIGIVPRPGINTPSCADLVGLNTLTAVQVLKVENATQSQRTLNDLMALTQLRYLRYSCRNESLLDQYLHASYTAERKELRAALPNTHVDF